MACSTQKVFEDHVAALLSGDVTKLMADYADDAIVLTLDGSFVGKQAVQAFFEAQLKSMPNFQASLGAMAVEGDTLLVQWSGESDIASISEAVDSFVIRDDKIQRQTGWFKVVPK
jgi:ketosteroid isomerase-like protein